MMKHYHIATQFTQYPGFRYREHSEGSGQEFREKILHEIMKTGSPVEIDLGGTSGYPSSFLEEAFGGLVRDGYSADQIRRLIHLVAPDDYQHYVEMAWGYIDKAEKSRSLSH